MSDAVSKVVSVELVGAAITGDAAGVALEGLVPLECQDDRRETRLEYDPTSRVPLPVVLVWIVSLLGLGAYLVVYCFGDLVTWGQP